MNRLMLTRLQKIGDRMQIKSNQYQRNQFDITIFNIFLTEIDIILVSVFYYLYIKIKNRNTKYGKQTKI